MSVQSHRFTIGDMQFTALCDGVTVLTNEAMQRRFPDVPEAEARSAYSAIGLDFDESVSSLNVLVASVGDEHILIDTGEGVNSKGGLLLESMAQAGISPENITKIIITHAHGDHVQGILNDQGEATFPNATYIISQAELDFWQGRIDTGMLDQRPMIDMMQAKGLRVIALDEIIMAGVTAVPIVGHTPGQIAVLFESEGQQLIHLADLLHSPMQFAHPEWSVMFDFDKTLSAPTRRATLARVADEGMLAMFYHLNFPSLGKVRRVGDAFAWQVV